MTLHTIGQVLLGAGFTAVAGAGGAATGYAIIPNGSVSTALGAVAAIVAAMAWVDKRIDQRFAAYGALEAERAKTRDETLLRKVEEMMHKE